MGTVMLFRECTGWFSKKAPLPSPVVLCPIRSVPSTPCRHAPERPAERCADEEIDTSRPDERLPTRLVRLFQRRPTLIQPHDQRHAPALCLVRFVWHGRDDDMRAGGRGQEQSDECERERGTGQVVDGESEEGGTEISLQRVATCLE